MLFALPARAQTLSDSYYMAHPQDEPDELRHDLSRYEEPLRGGLAVGASVDGLLEELVRYGLGGVEYRWRGIENSRLSERTLLAGIDLHSPLERYADYNITYLLGRIPAFRNHTSYASTTADGHLRSASYDARIYPQSVQNRLRVQSSMRNYRLGVGYSCVGSVAHSPWSYSLAVGGRWGRDAIVEGVFTEQEYLWLGAERSFRGPEEQTHRLMVALMCMPSLRSSRSWNVQETYDLTGNNYYNSYWGPQGDKVRSARTRKEVVPSLLATYDIENGRGERLGEVSLLARVGRKSRSSLEWDQATTPIPDYYAYLPSGYADGLLADMATALWRSGNEQYTQIDWNNLHHINSLSERGAVYALMDELSDIASVEVAGSVPLSTSATVGFEVGALGAHNYNVAADMLSATSLAEGIERYDYSTSLLYFGPKANADWSGDYGTLSVGGSLRWQVLHYTNHYGSTPSGPQTTLSGAEMRLKSLWAKSLSVGSVGAVLNFAQLLPHYTLSLATPKVGALRNPYATPHRSLGGQVSWSGSVDSSLQLSAVAYGLWQGGESDVVLFWNDLVDEYCALMAGGMQSLAVGVELSARYDAPLGIGVEGVLSLGECRYVADAQADIVAYDTASTIASATTLHLAGQHCGPTPRVVAIVGVDYRTERGWLVGIEGSLAAGRSVAPGLFYNSDYLLNKNISPEHRTALTAQEDLGTAFNMDVFAYRRFGRLGVSLSVRNLLGGDTIYSAYRPSRVAVSESDYAISYSPHATRYLYAYPTHLYISVSYDF